MRSRRTRRHRRRDPTVAALKPNLTPMIDITFQLVVFLLVAQDLAPTDPEPVELPNAVHSEADDRPDVDGRLTVTLAHAGDALPPRLTVRGVAHTERRFQTLLEQVANSRPRDPDGTSPVVLHLRTDERVAWQHVQMVMQACAQKRVRMNHIQFAARNPANGTSREDPRRLR
jgi:biopolymer transport protein ExbD